MDTSHRKIFISYSRKDYVDENEKIIPDSPIVKILRRLDSENIKRWIDLEGKYAGHSFVTEIISAIEQSDILVFISSKESNLSDYTPRELNVAIENNILIIPVRIDDTCFSKVVSFYLPGHIDRVEYYKNPDRGLDKLVNNIKSEFMRLDNLERQRVEEEERRRKEEEERKRKEEEERKRKEEEEHKVEIKENIERLKHNIRENIKRINERFPELVMLEKELDSSCDENDSCPVCGIENEGKDFCPNCGWFYKTAAERLIRQKRTQYLERLDYSTKIWKQKEELDETQNKLFSLEEVFIQKNQLYENLKSEYELFKETTQSNDNELAKTKTQIAELQKEKDKVVKENKEVKSKLQNESINRNKIDQELKKSKEENLKNKKEYEAKITDLQNKLLTLQKSKEEPKVIDPSMVSSNNIAYLLAEEYGQYSIYYLCEGVNTFGSIAKQKNSKENYQMIVAACPELQPKHFSINIKNYDKKTSILLEPYNSDCIVCLNSKNQRIKTPTSIKINDDIYIGELKLQIIDNFNK